MSSDPQDVVGQGQDYLYTAFDGAFTAATTGNSLSIQFEGLSSGAAWALHFQAPGQAPLATGVYGDATGWPSLDPTRPALAVIGNGGAGGPISGSFIIKQVVVDEAGQVNAFWAVFEQHCGGGSPALRGEIRYNADVQIDLRAPFAPVVERGQYLVFFVIASELQGNWVTLTSSTLPGGAMFIDFGDNSAAFVWQPWLDQVGEYPVSFVADNGLGATESFTTTVRVTGETQLNLAGDAGDPLGAGGPWTIGPTGGTFIATSDGAGGVAARVAAGSDIWTLEFRAPLPAPLTTAFYFDAVFDPGSGSGHPLLRISRNGQVCPASTGAFEVREIRHDAGGYLQSFRVRFAQQCPAGGPGLEGELRFNSAVIASLSAPLVEAANPGQAVGFSVTSTDIQGAAVSLEAAGLPPNAVFTDQADGTGTFLWTPGTEQTGDHVVLFQGLDAAGARDAVTTLIRVAAPAHPPVADAGGPYAGFVGTPIQFDGSRSTDPDGDGLQFHWDFGDGGTSVEARPPHTYAAEGKYLAILRVCDPGFCRADTALVQVADVLPARASMASGPEVVRLDTGRPAYCVRVEAVGGSFLVADVDPASVAMVSPKTGMVERIPASVDRPGKSGDKGRKFWGGLEACFSRDDLRRLFSNIRGQVPVAVTIEGRVTDGGFFRADLAFQVVGGGGATPPGGGVGRTRTIFFVLEQPGPVTIELFDLGGRLVRTILDDSWLAEGEHAVDVGGAGAGGRPLARGIYFYRVTAGGNRAGGKVLITD